MKRYLCIAAATLAYMAGCAPAYATPATDRNFAVRIACDLQAAGPASLADLAFQQGATPLLSVDQYINGKAVTADTSGVTVARFIMAPTATNATFVSATNLATAVTGNSYLIQLPTIGTNTASGAALTNGWWYSVRLEKSGYLYWSGSGRLDIEATTSTADGLVWQELTTSALVEAEAVLRAAGDVASSNGAVAAAAAAVPGIVAPILATCSVLYATSAGTATSATTAGTVTGAQSNLLATATQPGDLAAYLPLAGGTMSGDVLMLYGDNNASVKGTRFGFDTGYSIGSPRVFAGGYEAAKDANTSEDFWTALGYQSAYAAVGSYWNAFGYWSGFQAIGSNWNAVGENAGYGAHGNYWDAFGRGSGDEAVGNYWNAFGSSSGNSSAGDYWVGFGWHAMGDGIITNSAAFGIHAGRYARGIGKLYIDVYTNMPDYSESPGSGPENDTIFMDSDGKLYLGGGTNRAENANAGGVLRGAWQIGGTLTGDVTGNADTATTAGGLDPAGADGIRLAAAVVTPNGVGTNLTIAGLTIPYGSTQYYPGPLAASPTVTVSRASNSNLEVRVGSGSTCGITLGTAGLAICPATTPQGTLDLSDFDFGASTPRRVTIGNSTGSSAMFIGQSSTRFGSWSWSYNATPDNAAMSFGTASYSNPIKFNGSAIVFQGDNTSGNVGFGTASPAEKLHVIGSGIISSNLTVGAALTVTGNVTTAGAVYLGPSIGGSRAMLRTDGTNLFYITAGGGITNALTSNP